MDELGVSAHQAIYAAHRDTDNLHVHIALNRVHPGTLKCVEINRGFDLEAAHRAIARIEHVQGWQREQSGRYEVLDNGELSRARRDPDQPRQPDQRQRDMEHRTGEKSAQRIAIEAGAPIIKEAQTWAQLHRELAAKGMRYEKTGSGATLFVGEVGVKASSADRQASLSKLQQRLGVYEQPQDRQMITPREAEPMKPEMLGWNDYIRKKQAHDAAKAEAKLTQQKQHEQERQQLVERHRAERRERLRGNWKGKGDLLNAIRSVIAAEQAAEKAALKEQHRQEREQHRQRFRPYPGFEQWLRLHQQPELAEQWRYRASEPPGIEGEGSELPSPRDIRAYVAVVVGRQVHYRRRDEAAAGEAVSFVDKGKRIDIHDWCNRDSTLAALQLAAQKWGSLTVTGNEAYKAMCVKLAAEHGFKIANPELQEQLRRERQAHQRAIERDRPEREPRQQREHERGPSRGMDR